MTSDQKQKILDFVATQILGVVATVNAKGTPEATLVAVTETEDLELVFGTYSTARKYQNLKQNQHVAIVFGNDVDQAITVQCEGEAQELSGEELDRYRDLHIKKNPRSEKYAFELQQRFFKVNPSWIRYSDLGSDPQIEFELQF